MTNKDYDAIKDRMMELIHNGSPEVAWSSAKTLIDITVALEELKIRKDCHAQQMQDRIELRAKEIEQAAKLLAEQAPGCANSGKGPAEFPKVVVDKEREDLEYKLYHQPDDDAVLDAVLDEVRAIEDSCCFAEGSTPTRIDAIRIMVKGLDDKCAVTPVGDPSPLVTNIRQVLKECEQPYTRNVTLLEVADVIEVSNGHKCTTTILLAGGDNGKADWEHYFRLLNSIFHQFKIHGYDIWLQKLDTDCVDDVWYAYIGLRPPRNL